MSAPNENDWVSLRARCTVRHRFDELKKTLMDDVSKFNNLNNQYIGERRFYTDDATEMQLRIFRGTLIYDGGKRIVSKHPDFKNDPDHRIEITAQNDVFVARQGIDGQIMNVKICTQWNTDDLTCDYLVDGKAVSLSWISQRVLGDFMFQCLDGEVG